MIPGRFAAPEGRVVASDSSSVPGAERALWGEVLAQQMRDLADANGHCRSAAEAWIGDWPSRHFEMVCALAGLDAGAAHRFLRSVIAAPVELRRALVGGRDGRATRKRAPSGRQA